MASFDDERPGEGADVRLKRQGRGSGFYTITGLPPPSGSLSGSRRIVGQKPLPAKVCRVFGGKRSYVLERGIRFASKNATGSGTSDLTALHKPMRAITASVGRSRFNIRPRCAGSFLLSVATVIFIACCGPASGTAAEERNPFGVADVPNPDGEDVQKFAQKVKLLADDKDDNAPQWSEKPREGKAGILDGEWCCRWSTGGGGRTYWYCGTATVRTVKDRVYILCKDETGTFLIDLLRQGNRLVGRYLCVVGNTSDSAPWAGVIVDDERIDGSWSGGRWDLRRQLIPTVDKHVKDPSTVTTGSR